MKSFIRLTAALVVAVALVSGSAVAQQKKMLTGSENQVINVDSARVLVVRFQSSVPAGSVLGGVFGRNIFDKILAQPGCVGVRLYYAQKADGSPTVVLAGVDTYGNDIKGGVYGEDWLPCPPWCGVNGLNK